MHEMSLMGDVADVVIRYATENDAARITSVKLRIGVVRDTVDRLLQSCFSYLTKGTIAEGATREVEKVPLKLICANCHLIFPAQVRDAASFICPNCGNKENQIFSGTEFLIDRIEIDA